MKYIFLDIDGVLNNENTITKSPDGYMGVASNLGKRLKKIIKATDAKVILTSTWKNCSSTQDFDYLYRKLNMYSAKPIDVTIDRNNKVSLRGTGIKDYLKKYPCEQFVILDDYIFDFKEEGLLPHLVLTSTTKGLSNDDVKKAIDILNGNILDENTYNDEYIWGYHRN